MQEVSTFRLYLMRALYLLMFLFLTSTQWPMLLDHKSRPMMSGVAVALLAALGLMAGWALRYPLKMLPVLIFEFFWKTIWVVMIGVPLWRSGQLTGDYLETWKNCLPGVILVPLIIPWRYFWENYVKAPGDRWRPAQRAR